MTPTTRIGLIGAFVLLAAVAVAGWVRTSTSASTAQTAQMVPPPNGAPMPPVVPPPASYDQYGQAPPSANQVAYSESVPGSPDQGDLVLPEFACPHYVRTVTAAALVRPAYAEPPYGDADRMAPPPPPSYREREYVDRHGVHHRRSTRRSAEIVAGSAGVGAAIGAIAGGGKGAGIGALAGGGGGFIYDRLTRNH